MIDDKEMIVAKIVDTLDDAFENVDAALRFAMYIMEEYSERKLPDLEEELRNAQKGIDDCVKCIVLLKGCSHTGEKR